MPSTERVIFNFFRDRNQAIRREGGVIARVERAVAERDDLITSPYLETLGVKHEATKISSGPRVGGPIARVQRTIDGRSAQRVRDAVRRSPLQFRPEEAIAIVKRTAGSPRK